MGSIIAFRMDAVSARLGLTSVGAPHAGRGSVLILPVIRIERESDGTSGGSGSQEGAAPGRRWRRR